METPKNPGVKKRHLTLIGLVTVLVQFYTGTRNEELNKGTLRDIARGEMTKVYKNVADNRLDVEENFVRKSDVLDKLDRLETRMARIEGYLRRNQKYDTIEGRLGSQRRVVSLPVEGIHE